MSCDIEVKRVDKPKEECTQNPSSYAKNVADVLHQEKLDVISCGVCEESIDADLNKQVCEELPERGELILKSDLPPSISKYYDATCHDADHCKDEISNLGYEWN